MYADDQSSTLRSGASHDVIVVGARAAGAATAMLLARDGLRVLLLDHSRLGADTLSTHALMRGGVLQLSRWGLHRPDHRRRHPGRDADDVPVRPGERRHHHQTRTRGRRPLRTASHPPRPSARARRRRRRRRGIPLHLGDRPDHPPRSCGRSARHHLRRTVRRARRPAGHRRRRHPLDDRQACRRGGLPGGPARRRHHLRVLERSGHRRLRVELPAERLLGGHPHQRR